MHYRYFALFTVAADVRVAGALEPEEAERLMLKLDFKQQLGALGLAVSVEVPANGITAVFGLSGAGKTSSSTQ